MNKLMIQNRIDELEFKKKSYSVFYSQIFLPALLGITTIYLVVFSYFISNKNTEMIMKSFFIYLFVSLVLFVAFVVSIIGMRKKDKQIQNNYDLLLGRGKISYQKWLKIIRKK